MNSKDNSTKKQQKQKSKRKNPFRFFLQDFIKITGALTASIWLRPKRLFESKKAKRHVKGGAVVIANHTGVTDPAALFFAFWYRRIHIMAMKELFNSKVGGWFFRKALCIPVDRENFNTQTFREAVDVLNDGGILAIFPEGQINHDTTTVQSFKSGAVLMALRGNAPIVPVYIAPLTKWYKRAVMVIGEPINVKEICGAIPSLGKIEEVSKILREKELSLKEVYSKWKKK